MNTFPPDPHCPKPSPSDCRAPHCNCPEGRCAVAEGAVSPPADCKETTATVRLSRVDAINAKYRPYFSNFESDAVIYFDALMEDFAKLEGERATLEGHTRAMTAWAEALPAEPVKFGCGISRTALPDDLRARGDSLSLEAAAYIDCARGDRRSIVIWPSGQYAIRTEHPDGGWHESAVEPPHARGGSETVCAACGGRFVIRGGTPCAVCKAPLASGHASDCAVHNEPAYPNGPCDCGAEPQPGGTS